MISPEVALTIGIDDWQAGQSQAIEGVGRGTAYGWDIELEFLLPLRLSVPTRTIYVYDGLPTDWDGSVVVGHDCLAEYQFVMMSSRLQYFSVTLPPE